MITPAWAERTLEADRDPLVEDLFESEVLSASSPVLANMADLLPGEAPLVARAVAKRRHEFAAGRRCARALLERLGHQDFPLLRDENLAPRWPEGVVGSISHCADLSVAALSRSPSILGLGIDVESDAPLERRLWHIVCTPRERARLRRLPAERSGTAAMLTFSAKESVYKCVFSKRRARLGFQDAEIELDWDGGCFRAIWTDRAKARLDDLPVLSGRFARRGDWVLTGATWLASQNPENSADLARGE